MNANACQELKIRTLEHLGKGDGQNVFRLCLEDPGWNRWTPGQFAMVRPTGWGLEPLWARPFSIHRMDRDGLWLLVQEAGRGTAAMARMEPGQSVTVWGPLGNGFAVRPKGRTLLLAGGIGIAPFFGYAGGHPAPGSLELFFGHTAPLDNFPYAEMHPDVARDHFHEQGPGDLARFLELLKARMAARGWDLVLACGPTPFLRTIQGLAAELDLPCQLSLENRMACGVGACLGCVTKVPGGGLPVQVCSRGPVFWSGDVDLSGGA